MGGPNSRLVIARVLAGVTLAIVLTIIIVGPDVTLRVFVQAFGTTADTSGQIGSVVLLVLSAAAFVFSLKRRSFLVAGLLVASGVISVIYSVIVISMMANTGHSGHSPIHLVWDGLVILGLGVAKGLETRRMPSKTAII
jgi:hypothetical protein